MVGNRERTIWEKTQGNPVDVNDDNVLPYPNLKRVGVPIGGFQRKKNSKRFKLTPDLR